MSAVITNEFFSLMAPVYCVGTAFFTG